jgi:hypothetical protein
MYDRATNLHECDVYLSGRSLRSLTPDPSQRQVTMPHPTRTRQRHRGPCTVATRACSRRPATSGRHVVSFHGGILWSLRARPHLLSDRSLTDMTYRGSDNSSPRHERG